MLIHEQPTSQGMLNALKRAHQLRDLKWTPIAKMPMTVRYARDGAPVSEWVKGKWPVWKPQHGIPYSSVRIPEKFVGWNVSIETYMTALKNPKSVLYTRDLTGCGERQSSWYGSVCSAYVSYVYNLRGRTVCGRWPKRPDMEFIEDGCAAKAHLLYGLLSKSHVMVITDVVRDENDQVVEIEVSEETLPQIIATRYTPEEFDHCVTPKYRMFKYLNINQVTYTPSPFVHVEGDPELPAPFINPVLLPDYGDKANYRLGEIVELNVMQDGWDKLVVEHEDGKITFCSELSGKGVVAVKPARPGFYSAWCEKDGEKSPAVRFCMTDLHIELEKTDAGYLVKLPTDVSPKIVYAYRLSDMGTTGCYELSDEQIAAGEYLLNELPPEQYEVRVTVGNEFGDYNGYSEHFTVE